LKIFFENVDISSRSGPNSFGKKLLKSLEKRDCEILTGIPKEQPDVQLAFIASGYKIAPTVQRLDGIYFNTDQDFNNLNIPIQSTYASSDSVIFQSNFNRDLTFHYFGKKENSHVIPNGTDIELISKIPPMENKALDEFENVWTCASSWRPHKRLSENVRYFLEFSKKSDCLIIAGNNPDVRVADPRIFYSGDLDWPTLISLYKRSKYFIHLAFLDHCPNVVVDARASGCKVICSSTGGTSEISGKDSIVIEEEDWDFTPIRLYNPPKMNFSNTVNTGIESNLDIDEAAIKYLKVLKSVV
jgi:glycosyltransferase involved in cell wall biosynthesis